MGRFLRLHTCVGVAAAASLIALVIPGSAGAASGSSVPMLEPASGSSAFSRYVAMGDSYTSSPLTGLPTGPNGFGCTRSDNNYPHLVRNALQPTEFADLSCGGATTNDVFAPHSGPFGGTNQPQISAVTANTTLVSVSFGGNDIGFGEIVENCVSLLPFGAPCRDRYTAGDVDQLAARIAATAPKIDRVLAEVRARAPSARIFVVGYPAILPDTGGGCWPLVPYTARDVSYLRATEKRLNSMLADRATFGGAFYADTYTGSIGHDVCQLPAVKWIEGLLPTAPAAPVHPNAAGSRGMADLVLQAIHANPT